MTSETPHIRPDRDQYYMGIALAVRARANCRGSKVGAVIVREDRIVSTGYNGTAQGLPNCEDGGCQRCENRGSKYASGEAYDLCICVHAEQNAILSSARFGTPIEGTDVYTTLRPCFNCTKELVQARVRSVRYMYDWVHPREDVRDEYKRLQSFIKLVAQVKVDDPDAAWAAPGLRGPLQIDPPGPGAQSG
jgi:dCMP deaminase